jgi:hypothetical protein
VLAVIRPALRHGFVRQIAEELVSLDTRRACRALMQRVTAECRRQLLEIGASREQATIHADQLWQAVETEARRICGCSEGTA